MLNTKVIMYDVWETQYRMVDYRDCEDCPNATFVHNGPDDFDGYECNLEHNDYADGCPFYLRVMEKEEDYEPEHRNQTEQGQNQLNS